MKKEESDDVQRRWSATCSVVVGVCRLIGRVLVVAVAVAVVVSVVLTMNLLMCFHAHICNTTLGLHQHVVYASPHCVRNAPIVLS